MDKQMKQILSIFLATSTTFMFTGCSASLPFHSSDDALEKAKKDTDKFIQQFKAPDIDVVSLADVDGRMFRVERADRDNERKAICEDDAKEFVVFLIDDNGNLLYESGNREMLDKISEVYLSSLGFVSPSLNPSGENVNLLANSGDTESKNNSSFFPFWLWLWTMNGAGSGSGSGSYASTPMRYRWQDQTAYHDRDYSTGGTGGGGGVVARTAQSSSSSSWSKLSNGISSPIKPSTATSSSSSNMASAFGKSSLGAGFTSARGGFGGVGARAAS